MNKTKDGFTLAEVLITLAIIGVVAAVTLPMLVKNYQKKVFVSRLQKTYSELNNASKLTQAEYGDPNSWDMSLSGGIFFQTYLAPYLKIASIKPKSEIEDRTYYQISGTPETGLAVFQQSKSSKVNIVTLTNGVQLLWWNEPNGTLREFYIDVNGIAKPNTFGKDMFMLYFLENGEIMFHQRCDNEPISTRRTIEELKTNQNDTNSRCYSYQCDKSGQGMWCGALIQQSGWKIPDDYPW